MTTGCLKRWADPLHSWARSWGILSGSAHPVRKQTWANPKWESPWKDEETYNCMMHTEMILRIRDMEPGGGDIYGDMAGVMCLSRCPVDTELIYSNAEMGAQTARAVSQ